MSRCRYSIITVTWGCSIVVYGLASFNLAFAEIYCSFFAKRFRSLVSVHPANILKKVLSTDISFAVFLFKWEIDFDRVNRPCLCRRVTPVNSSEISHCVVRYRKQSNERVV